MNLTLEMSRELDEELNLNIHKADLMRSWGKLETEEDYIAFIRNLMLNKAYPRIYAEAKMAHDRAWEAKYGRGSKH